MWDDVGMARTDASLDARARRDSQAARRVLAQRLGARDGRQPEPEPRIRRPRRRLPRVRRAAGARRARARANRAAATSAKRARRPTARRCATTSITPTCAAWEFKGVGATPELHKEPLEFHEVHPSRSGQLQASDSCMRLNLKIWRQAGPDGRGRLVDYAADNVSPDMSFLEMLDVVNEGLIDEGRGRDRVRLRLPRRHLRHVQPRRQRRPARTRPRHDGLPAAHAARSRTATRSPSSRGAPRPSRSSRIWSSIAARSTASSPAGGYVSVNVRRRAGRQRHPDSEGRRPKLAMDSAACIGCGACVAACKNASAHLFMSAKISHLALLPQGQQSSATRRVVGDDRSGRRRRLRQLLERGRVRSGLPEGDSDLQHRAHDARVQSRHSSAPASRPPSCARPAKERFGGFWILR